VREPGSDPPAGGDAPLKVLVTDDHPLIREGLKLLLQQLDEAAQVFEADSLTRAIEIYRAQEGIGLVLLDLSMPGTFSSDTLQTFKTACPTARVVVVSATCDVPTVQSTLRKGALGFIPKVTSSRIVLHALRFVLEGGIYVPLEAFTPAAQAGAAPDSPAVANRPAPPTQPVLTPRQMDVLRELLQGKSNKQICRDLNMAMGTVKSHLAGIFGELRVGSRTEAIAAAERLGWRRSAEVQEERR
jgi:DNA-binding NarL/FixJ family response regulator